MKTSFYIIINQKGLVKSRSTKPVLNAGEIAIKLKLNVSDLFFERFIPEATIEIPDDKVIEPEIEVGLE